MRSSVLQVFAMRFKFETRDPSIGRSIAAAAALFICRCSLSAWALTMAKCRQQRWWQSCANPPCYSQLKPCFRLAVDNYKIHTHKQLEFSPKRDDDDDDDHHRRRRRLWTRNLPFIFYREWTRFRAFSTPSMHRCKLDDESHFLLMQFTFCCLNYLK